MMTFKEFWKIAHNPNCFDGENTAENWTDRRICEKFYQFYQDDPTKLPHRVIVALTRAEVKVNTNPQMTCSTCNGTGKVDDQVQIGSRARMTRERAGVSLRSVARAMGVSASFISDLELGRRIWTEAKQAQFQKIIAETACADSGGAA